MLKLNQKTDTSEEIIIFNYALVVSILSILLFLYGFFPSNYTRNDHVNLNDIPTSINNISLPRNELYKPAVQRIIFIVIDAWRWDFIEDPNTRKAMPNFDRILQNKDGCIFKTRVNTPTVTMPRIKAMMTGTVPNFIDVILNLGSTQILSDNLLKQAKDSGHKIIFFGDEVWMKLFPNIFHRYDATSSFYVTDFTEVDTNVTRHIDRELDQTDWSIMILHYLGLDHIGHITGPYSNLIKPKLQEMDEVIGKMFSHVSQWNEDKKNTLILITGDHGMKDSGSHGGSTAKETLVPLFVLGKTCTSANLEDEIAQIDLASTMSVLLGLPIPASNLGTLIDGLIEDWTVSRKLFSLYYNSQQIYTQFKKLLTYNSYEHGLEYLKATELHIDFLKNNGSGTKAMNSYKSVSKQMKDQLMNSAIMYNVPALILAILILFQVLHICLAEKRDEPRTSILLLIIFPICIVSIIYLHLLFKVTRNLSFYELFSYNYALTPVCLLIFEINFYFLITRRIIYTKIHSPTVIFCIIGVIVHAVSLSSSSFIEEEHQTWYFYWITIILLMFYKLMKQNMEMKEDGSVNFKVIAHPIIALMLIHRLARLLNSTGDKYAHLPDISDWLMNETSQISLTFAVIFSLAMLIWVDYISPERLKYSLFFDLITSLFIYLRHATNGSICKPHFYPKSKGLFEIHIFWILQLLIMGFEGYQLRKIFFTNKTKFSKLLLYLLLKKWVIVSSLLHRPYNVILIPFQILSQVIILNSVDQRERFRIDIYLIIWSSNAFYFYQGNSNSIATIDLAAGYVGLTAYKPIIVGLFLAINTYSAQVIGLLLYFFIIELQFPSMSLKEKLSKLKTYVICRLIPFTFYAIIAILHRYHLFIWTVFSPKLLYEVAHCLVIFMVIMLLQTVLFFQDKIKVKSL